MCTWTMKIKVGAEDDEISAYIPASSSNNLFTDQAAGLLGNSQNAHWRSDIVGNPFDVREIMIAREIEKKKIREEIITAGLLSRRELEKEVIREMMMEREFFMRRGSEGLPLVDPLSRPEVQGVPVLGGRNGIGMGIGIQERLLGLSRREGGIDGSLSSIGCPEGGVLGGFPFQCRPGVTSAVAAKPVNELSKGQVVLLGKTANSTVAGIKRKFEVPITEGGVGSPSYKLSKMSPKKWSCAKKESEKKWRCALCQVAATCERGLKDHLKGKKHKAKEKALLRTSQTVSNNADESKALAEEDENSNELVVPTGRMRSTLGKCLDQNLEGVNDLEAMDHTMQHKEDGSAEVSEKQSTTELNTDFKFWCTLCNVGTNSEALMMTHRMGKKHTTLLQKNGGGVIAIKTVPYNFQYINETEDTVAEGKEESLGNADGEADRGGADQKEYAVSGELVTVSIH